MAEALHAYYERDEERERLSKGLGLVEFLRTTEVIGRTLPATGTIADIGGGPGRYTDWLVERGYAVVHRDIVPLHVDHVRATHGERVDSALGDARAFDLADNSVDAALFLGPLYHLEERDDRLTALREAARIVKPGGYVYAAIITRWAARLHGMLIEKVHEKYPVIESLIDGAEQTGVLEPLHEAAFCAYAHRPDELRGEVIKAGLSCELLASVEGISFALSDLDERLADDTQRAFLFETLRRTEAVPELLGVGPHLLAVCQKLQ